jgi:uncharacterized protein (TIGR02594 family)
MVSLPKKYEWIDQEQGPRLLQEMRKLYGTIEAKGNSDNPLILQWAKQIGLGNVYQHDSIAWCGLTVAYAAAQAGWDHAPNGNALWARNWANWGTPVEKGQEMLSDVLVFARGNAGHVAIYIGEDSSNFHIIGGNQDDKVSIKTRPKSGLIAARRCPWRVNQPPNIRKILLNSESVVAGGSEA